MHAAASSTNPALVEVLVRAQAEVDARSLDGSTPLLLAARNGHERTVEALLAAGADASARDDLGRSALGYAVARKNEALILILSGRRGSP